MFRTRRARWQRMALSIYCCMSCCSIATAQSASRPGGNPRQSGNNRNAPLQNVRPQSAQRTPPPVSKYGAPVNRSGPARISTSQAPAAKAPAVGGAAVGGAAAKVAKPAPMPATPQSVLNTTTFAREVAGEKFSLQHRLKAGEVIRTRTTHVVNALTRIQGAEDVSESKSISDKVWDVKSVDASGPMTFEYRIEAVDMSQKQSDQPEITYNSRTDKSAPDKFGPLADTIAKPIAMVTIDPSGKIIERDNQSKTPPLGMGELAIPLPKEPVAVGAQWNLPRECRVKLENGTQKVMKLREQYTLEKVSAGVATIRVQTQALTPVDEPSVEAQLMQQMSQGVIKFDVDRGRLISKQLDWDDEIVGFRGAETSLKYTARFTEEEAEDTIQSANNPTNKKR